MTSLLTSNNVDTGYYLPRMERRDWSDLFVFVTINNINNSILKNK